MRGQVACNRSRQGSQAGHVEGEMYFVASGCWGRSLFQREGSCTRNHDTRQMQRGSEKSAAKKELGNLDMLGFLWLLLQVPAARRLCACSAAKV